jgi:hypothetical protein
MPKDDYGSLKFAGQQGEVTFNLEAAVQIDDAVTSTATAGLLGRGADGGEIVGVVFHKSPDLVGTVYTKGSNRVVTCVRNGAIALGFVALQVDGAGKVKAGGAGLSKFHVIGTKTYNSVDFVTFIL